MANIVIFLAWMSPVAMTMGIVGFALFHRERLIRIQLTSKLDSMAHKMKSEAMRDKLTGLLIRSNFKSLLDDAVNLVDRAGGAICIIYVALDNMRMINDAHGHDVGDQLVREAARRIASCTDTEANACRVAAGDFALIVTGNMTVGRAAANKIIAAFSEVFTDGAHFVQLSCSIGVTSYPEHGSRSKLLSNAELASRSVKLSGGGGFSEYDPQMGVDARDQAKMLSELRNALANQEFELYFQPKIDAISMQVTSAEALLRWKHPERGFVSPTIFIPLAERHGLIGGIGNWVIEEACRHAAQWRRRGLRMRVAVNISGYQMREPDLVDRIEIAIKKNNIRPERFTCEMTESVAMEDTVVTKQTFEKMRTLGLHVSIDDFGTGYSSLAALRKLPAEQLKIDRAFVMDLEDSAEARSIVLSIINLAQSLELKVVAEGVETLSQCQLLIEMGCHELQGYLFSQPIPADDLERLALDEGRIKDILFRPSLYQDTKGVSSLMVLPGR